jgi:hypothetical protein
MSAPKMGQGGPKGAQKALKTPENRVQMTQSGVLIQSDSVNERFTTSFISYSDFA